MSKVLILCIPSHGHVNPILGLAIELIHQGEEVTFFCAEEFRKSIEDIGAAFKCYQEDLNIFQKKQGNANDSTTNKKKPVFGFVSALLQPDKFIDDVLHQIRGFTFDYLIHSAAYPYAHVIAQVLKIPAISSFAIFATQKDLFKKKTMEKRGVFNFIPFKWKVKVLFFLYYRKAFKKVRQAIYKKYGVAISRDMLSLFTNKGNLNIIYTSKYFIPHPEYYDDSFIFVGPPIYHKPYEMNFPFEKLAGKKVIYISMGTIFSNHSAELNQLFFQSFAGMDVVVVMAAYQVDLSTYAVPENFIIMNYVPQLELLKHTSVAITHAGMNSIGDLLYHKVPFVAIPLGADQYYMANRTEELGATIVLDIHHLTPDILRDAVEKVLTNPGYLENMKKISHSFREAGGYKKAVEEIFKLKKPKIA